MSELEQEEEPKHSNSETFALIERHRGGDQAALGLLVERYLGRVEAVVRIRLGSALLERETVADVVQDVFVRILEGLERYERRNDARFIDWVARLAQNEIANHARSARAKKRAGTTARLVRDRAESASDWDVVDETSGVPSKVSRCEQLAILERHLSEMSEPHREVILLRNYHGGDWKTVAEEMNRSPEACQELYRRAKRDLGRRMQGASGPGHAATG